MVNKLRLFSMQISAALVRKENETNNPIGWYGILETFEFEEILENHPRLLRSQTFGDEDYPDEVRTTIYDCLVENEKDAMAMITFLSKEMGINIDAFNERFGLEYGFILENPQIKEIDKTVFISYSNKNKEHCHVVEENLNKIGLNGFLAHDDINVSREWADEIFKQINNSNIVIALLSEEFKKSDYCSQEVGMALQKDALIIPLSIDGTESYGFLNRYQSKHIDNIFQMNKAIFEGYPSAMVDIQLDRLVNFDEHWNYDKCNYLLELMAPHFEKFSGEQINKFIGAVLTNNQLHGDKGHPFLKRFYEIHKDRIRDDLRESYEQLI